MDRLRQIEMVVRAADTGSFARAAATLNVTPSAMSHAIAQLEKQLRTQLFYRTTRQLRLTEDGEAFCRRGREILEKLTELDAVTGGNLARPAGKIRVGVGTVIAQYITMPRLAEFLQQHAGLSVECRQRWHVKEMHSEAIDVLLWVGGQPDPGVIAHKLCDLRFNVYGAPGYLKSHGIPTHPRELARHRCLVYFPPSWATKPLDNWGFQRGNVSESVKINPTLLCDEREMLIAAAVNGAGLIRTGFFDPALIATGRLRRVLEDWTCTGAPAFYAMYRKSQRQSPKVAAFVEFVKDAVAEFDPEELTVIHESADRPVRHTISASGGRRTPTQP